MNSNDKLNVLAINLDDNHKDIKEDLENVFNLKDVQYNLTIINSKLFRNIKNNKNKYDLLYCIHTLEHINHLEIFSVIDNLIRLVKIDGLICFITPSLDWVAKEIIENRVDSRVMFMLYDKYNNHKSAYSLLQLRKLLERTEAVITLLAHLRNKRFEYDKFGFDAKEIVIIVKKVKEVDNG